MIVIGGATLCVSIMFAVLVYSVIEPPETASAVVVHLGAKYAPFRTFSVTVAAMSMAGELRFKHIS